MALYNIAESQSKFTFANSESTSCKQKLVVCMYDREYAVQSTEFDIVEQGHVPTLMSLPQMRNLRFQFDLQPEKAFLSSSVLGIENMQLKVAPSSHLVLDLIDLSEYMWHVRFGKFKKSSFLTYYMHYEYGFHQKLSGGSSFEEVPEEPEGLVFATEDEWMIDEDKMELIRVHKKTRQIKYDPKDGQTPILLEFLDVKRTTIMEFSKEKIVTQEDDWRSTERHTTRTPDHWRGKTVLFRILPGGLESRTSVPAKSRFPSRSKTGSPDDIVNTGKPEDSSKKPGTAGGFPLGKEPVRRRVRIKGSGPLGPVPKKAAPPPIPEEDPDLHEYAPSEPGDPLSEEARKEIFPDRKDVQDVSSLPLPGHEVSRASPQYQRMLEKLNNEVELYKLHVKHYHMSPAQFRRRTSMLGLPGEIYDKYDKIFRTCRVCSTSVPTPPRGPCEFGSARDVELFFDSGMRRTIVFRRESLEIKLSSLISSCPTTSSMVLHHTLVVLVLLGQTVPRPPFVFSNGPGRLWQRLWLMRVTLRRVLFVKQSRRWRGQGTASLPFQAILRWR